MKTKLIILVALVGVTVACSDFFKGKTVDSEMGVRPTNPSGLPDKATVDPRACEYGEFEAADSRQDLLWNLTSQTLCPKVREFRYYVTLLRLSVDQSCVGGDQKNADQDVMYLWGKTTMTLEYLLANPLGPMQDNMKRLAMEIYAWPDFNRWSTKWEVMKAHELGDGYTMNLAPSRKGLASVEYLLSNPDMIVEKGPGTAWRPGEQEFNALPFNDRRAARCRVLKALLNDVGTFTEELYNAWSATGGAYPVAVLQRVRNGEAQTVLNELSDGLYYIEKMKDFKLGYPLGLNQRCASAVCPEAVEFKGTGLGVPALRQNLEAFRDAAVGPSGFADQLIEVGRPELAVTLRERVASIDAALADLEATGETLDQRVLKLDKALCVDASSPEPACRGFFALRDLMSFWKSEVLSALDLQQPRNESDGD